MPYIKGGEYIVDFLIKEKVPFIFGICGHGNVGLLDALYDRKDEIRLVSPRHEQAAGHMADVYYRVTHKSAATLTSIGPGSANLPMALANAFMDSSGILVLTANAPTQQAARGAFQEMYRHHPADFASMLRPCAKRIYQPQRVDMLPLMLRQAYSLSGTGRPGPVVVDIPFNVFQEEAEVSYEAAQTDAIRSRTGASPDDVSACFDLLQRARRPLIFAGNGVTLSEAGPELTALVERLQIPVVNLPNGMGTLDMRNPLALGFVGRNGAYQANEAARKCDVLLTLGARFDDRSASSWIPGYSWNIPPTRLIQVDIDPSELGRNYSVTLGIAADVKTFLRQILDELSRHEAPDLAASEPWREDIRIWRTEWQAKIASNFDKERSPLQPEQVIRDLRAVLPDDAIVIPDVGAHHSWFMQFWEARQPQTLLNAYGFGGMGFSVCGVLGAKLAAPERVCVSVCGDGGFMMAPHVLATAVEYDISAIWVVWNNFGWTAIRDIQTGMFQGREIGTLFYRDGERWNPDFAAMARSCGVEALTVEHGRDLKGALEHAILLNKPMLIDLHVDGDIHLPSTGAWQLPPTPYRDPAFGERYLPSRND